MLGNNLNIVRIVCLWAISSMRNTRWLHKTTQLNWSVCTYMHQRLTPTGCLAHLLWATHPHLLSQFSFRFQTILPFDISQGVTFPVPTSISKVKNNKQKSDFIFSQSHFVPGGIYDHLSPHLITIPSAIQLLVSLQPSTADARIFITLPLEKELFSLGKGERNIHCY